MFGAYEPLPIRLGGSPTDGWAAAQHARASADIVAACRACPIAWLTFTIGGDFPTPILSSYNGMYGSGSKFAPLIARISDGFYIAGWPPVAEDAYGRPEPIAFRHAKAICRSVSPLVATTLILSDLVSVEIRVSDLTGAAVDSAVTLRVS